VGIALIFCDRFPALEELSSPPNVAVSRFDDAELNLGDFLA
jgi:hypothetical protein